MQVVEKWYFLVFSLGLLVSCLYLYSMALQAGINCINLMEEQGYASEVKGLANRLGLPYQSVSNPGQIKAYTYLLWIGSDDFSMLRVWLNRIDFCCSGNTRIGWFPKASQGLNLPNALDFGLMGSDLKGIEHLITAQQKAFSPFFDHISGLAFKNALGHWTLNPG